MVYLDNMARKFGRMILCHMVADTVEELHQMAEKIGVNRRWFQEKSFPHYDVCLSKAALAVSLGAKDVSQIELGRIILKLKESEKKP
jgi:alkanesulfonate monooxygenase SsuD/methylene tetrahydromethanopterin reductase-like flavin-dependent oxidoreductase (luciferase family)